MDRQDARERAALAKDFRNIDPRGTRILLVEAGPRLLPSFPQDLSDDALRQLERLGVEVRLGAPVTAVDASGVTIDTARIEARNPFAFLATSSSDGVLPLT
jgi:NADH:ubiquinone reductase (H+-translocating)